MKNKILNTKLLPDMVGIFYTGQVGFILKYNEKYILIDGYLSDYVDRNCCSENVKWVRKYPVPIHPEDLDFIDYVFCTHSHFDHADPDTLSTLAKINNKAKYIVSKGIKDTILSYGIKEDDLLAIDTDVKIQLDNEISATAIPAAHEQLHKDENGNYLEVGFKLTLGDTTLFHAGDGCPYPELTDKIGTADILIMPVNGRDYFRTEVLDIIGCFDSNEAITIAKQVNAILLIPCHFDLYDVNCINPAHFVDCLKEKNPDQKFHIFAPGEKFIFQK